MIRGMAPILIVLSLVSIMFFPSVVSAQPQSISVYIGPFVDHRMAPITTAKVFVNYGSESYNTTTATNGTAHLFLPASWVNKTVAVHFEKDGYQDETFTGNITIFGTFVPTNGSLPQIQESHKAPTVDWGYLVIALIVIVVLAVVLVGMKEPSKVKHGHKKNDKKKKPVEEE
jgi:hypothetical protein